MTFRKNTIFLALLILVLSVGCKEGNDISAPKLTTEPQGKDNVMDAETGGPMQGHLPIDIDTVAVEIADGFIIFSITLYGDQQISAPSQTQENGIGGMIDIDLDYVAEKDSSSGGPVYWFGKAANIDQGTLQTVNFDLSINFRSEASNPNHFALINSKGERFGWIEDTISPSSIQCKVPLDLLVGAGMHLGKQIAYSVLVGDEGGPTDVAPPTPGIVSVK